VPRVKIVSSGDLTQEGPSPARPDFFRTEQAEPGSAQEARRKAQNILTSDGAGRSLNFRSLWGLAALEPVAAPRRTFLQQFIGLGKRPVSTESPRFFADLPPTTATGLRGTGGTSQAAHAHPYDMSPSQQELYALRASRRRITMAGGAGSDSAGVPISRS